MVALAAAAVVIAGLAADTGAQPAAARVGQTRLEHGAATAVQVSDSSETPFNYCLGLRSDPAAYPGAEGPFPVSDYVAGYSNAGKLSGSVPLGPALLRNGPNDGLYVDSTDTLGPLQPGGPVYGLCQLARLHLDDNGQPEFPPATGTFLGFGFEPVTATVQLTQVGLRNPPPVTEVAYSYSVADADGGNTQNAAALVTTAQVLLRVVSARVNGVPLDVGSDCRTTGPVYTPDSQLPADLQIDPGDDLVVTAGGDAPADPLPAFGQLISGGAVVGEVTIPPLTGCGDLDPLLTASVSGPGNYVKLNVGPVCAPIISPACTSAGLPIYKPLWTVTHGGAYTASGGSINLTGTTFPGGKRTATQIVCTGSTIAGAIPGTAGPPRGAQGTFRWTGFSGCTGPQGSTWQITQQGTAILSAQTYIDGQVSGALSGLSLTLKGTLSDDTTCTVQLTEPFDSLSGFTYAAPNLQPALLLDVSPGSTCPSYIASNPVLSGWTFNPFVPAPTYSLHPDTITMTSP